MYHEEKVIDGILCWRGTPDGEWTKYSAKKLTEIIIKQKQKIDLAYKERS